MKRTWRIAEYLIKLLEDTHYEPLYYFIFFTYDGIVLKYLQNHKEDEVAEYADLALSYAVQFDDFIASDRQIALTKDKLKHDILTNFGSFKDNLVKRMLTWYENNPQFKESVKTRDFSAIIEKYRPYAKNINDGK